jgi:glycosyltransferase involved in cell wall biosynthesis
MSPPPPLAAAPAVDAVVIGRNEGARLVACLASLGPQVRRMVYVDSGSTDGSVAAARAAGAMVVELDLARPFTAARARNAGLAALDAAGGAEVVQLVDGDCTLAPGWVAHALPALLAAPRRAIVFGRRRERAPGASVYNRLCDWEWDVPVGEVAACGGDILVRRAALAAVGDYREDVIAAEDDELCQRLRAAGWTIARIEGEMTLHDAAMARFAQWWRRAVRAGHGFAQVGALHPGHFVAARRRVWIWGLALPGLALAGLVAAPVLLVPVGAAYALSWARVARRLRARGEGWREAAAMAGLVTLSKLPNLQGMATYGLRRLRGGAMRIIEYK